MLISIPRRVERESLPDEIALDGALLLLASRKITESGSPHGPCMRPPMFLASRDGGEPRQQPSRAYDHVLAPATVRPSLVRGDLGTPKKPILGPGGPPIPADLCARAHPHGLTPAGADLFQP